MAPVAQFEGGVEMPVRAGLHQVDGVMVGPAAQEREEVAHPVGFAKAEHVAIELGDVLDVGDVEGDVAELERHDAFGLEFLMREGVALEHLHDGAFGIGEHQHVGDRRLGVLAALGLDAVACDLLFELVEIAHRARSESRRARIAPAGLCAAPPSGGRRSRRERRRPSPWRRASIPKSRCNIRSADRDRASRSWHARSC